VHAYANGYQKNSHDIIYNKPMNVGLSFNIIHNIGLHVGPLHQWSFINDNKFLKREYYIHFNVSCRLNMKMDCYNVYIIGEVKIITKVGWDRNTTTIPAKRFASENI